MRSDMHKVIVERPRILRSKWKNRKTALRLSESQRAQAISDAEDHDGGRSRASSARHGKYLNENLAPLKRYLNSQVGRPWDKVYSEICRTIDTRSAIGLHVLQHVEHFIAVDTFIENGKVCEYKWRCAMEVQGLYVHPVTGIIRLTKRRQSQSERAKLTLVAVSETLEFEKIDGLWFQMEYRPCDPDESGVGRILVRKRQCDRKTIREIEQGKLEVSN
ncbi:MAG: hypothetical protein ABSE86_17770 [Bryobacteraceae bacterium]|jgi:hypothetical protein